MTKKVVRDSDVVLESQKSIVPETLALIRESRGYSQEELARIVGVSQGMISKIEHGFIGASEDLIAKLEEKLRYPRSLLFATVKHYSVGSYYHRKRQACRRRILLKNDCILNLKIFHIQKLLNAVEISDVLHDLYFDLDQHGSPQEIARLARHTLNIPSGPIKNLTKSIEDVGGIVVLHDFETNHIDGISFFKQGMSPIIFLNCNLAWDRLRWTLSHELAHILMHHGYDQRPQEEDEANLFASEFLMPEADIKHQLYGLNLERLLALKLEWRVSMSAIIERAYQLKKIDPNWRKVLHIQMSKAGYRKHEPAEYQVKTEEPNLLKELIDLHLKELGYSTREICEIMHIMPDRLHELYGKPINGLRFVK